MLVAKKKNTERQKAGPRCSLLSRWQLSPKPRLAFWPEWRKQARKVRVRMVGDGRMCYPPSRILFSVLGVFFPSCYSLTRAAAAAVRLNKGLKERAGPAGSWPEAQKGWLQPFWVPRRRLTLRGCSFFLERSRCNGRELSDVRPCVHLAHLGARDRARSSLKPLHGFQDQRSWYLCPPGRSRSWIDYKRM